MNEKDLEHIEELSNQITQEVSLYKEDLSSSHPYDIAEQLLKLRDLDEEQYSKALRKIPSTLLAEVLSEMPDFAQEEIGEYISTRKLVAVATNMDTDDAADFIQNISEDHEEMAQTILESFDDEDKELLEQLIAYGDSQAGAYMQTELFKAYENENIGNAIRRLKVLKESGEVDNIWHCHVTTNKGVYTGSVGLEELIIFEHKLTFADIPQEKFNNYNISHTAEIKEAVEMITNYNLTSMPVVDDRNKLIGRITSDDVYDIIEESATEQIYNMAGVDDEAEQEENIFEIGKGRAFWLCINLVTAIAASLVIGLFDATIQSLVALAVLMPIVASMGGNAGTQTLTVTVRQMALGDIESEDAKKTIYKEVLISLANGFIFAIVIGVIAYFWFKIPLLGVVIAISMVINLVSAGFFGAMIPLALQKAGIDPAIGSTVLLTTVTDIVGFFSFLGLATLILL
jgi:magnesium transporter